MNDCEKKLGVTEEEMVDTIVRIETLNFGVISLDYIRPIAEKIVKDVMEDLCASADVKKFNDDDIRLAFGRVLYDKLYAFQNSGFDD